MPDVERYEFLDATLKAEYSAARDVVLADRDSVQAWIDLGVVASRSYLPEVELEIWATLADLAPEDPRWPYFAGEAAARALDADTARRWFERTIELDERAAHAWRHLGSVALDTGDVEAARVAFERVRSIAPAAHDGHTGLALVALAEGNGEAAVRHARLALERSPDDVYQRFLLGSALRSAGRVEEARHHLAVGQGSTVRWSGIARPGSPGEADESVLIDRADALAAEAKLAEAARLYRRVSELRPGDGRVAARLATVLAAQGKSDEALEVIDEALARTPSHYFLLRAKSDVLVILERADEAREVLEQAIEAWPNRAAAWAQLGELEASCGRPGPALNAFDRAYELEPTEASVVSPRAMFLVRHSQWVDAAEFLERAIPRVSNPPVELYQLLRDLQVRVGRPAAVLAETDATIRRLAGPQLSPR